MKRIIIFLLMAAMLLTGCRSKNVENAPDPRAGLVEHYYDGLYFYLSEDFKQVDASEGGAAFQSSGIDLHVQSCYLADFAEDITSAADFAATYADMVDDDVEDVQIFQANGVWYAIISSNGYTLICGFYVLGEYGWMIGAVTQMVELFRDDLIRYVTLGKIKDGFVPAPRTPTTSSQYRAGDEMFDLSVTTIDGESCTVADILKEKKLVVLNFWFADCGWCIKEFPAMEVAYQQYREDIEILALNPVDDTDRMDSFRQEHSLSMPIASCSRDTALAFGINGYPTSVFIDRDGKIALIHSGAITDTAVFYKAFDYFTAEDYRHEPLRNINQL
ncbi:MAG: TlpA family protein disulfide reductase [Ruminococcaceae bacterium]|nr:TlpA family protein disulfide reductase [Oscillospiraceae bacterium]